MQQSFDFFVRIQGIICICDQINIALFARFFRLINQILCALLHLLHCAYTSLRGRSKPDEDIFQGEKNGLFQAACIVSIKLHLGQDMQ